MGREVQRLATERDAEREQTCFVFWLGRGIGKISRNMVRGRSSDWANYEHRRPSRGQSGSANNMTR